MLHKLTQNPSATSELEKALHALKNDPIWQTLSPTEQTKIVETCIAEAFLQKIISLN